ncbi:hypothetical protein FRB90_010542 [Tulasnella sp. 427]|nr:hypothetical protein FRB90_010542 [Tulasnella sp. 427]
MVAVTKTSEMQKFALSLSIVPVALVLASFVCNAAGNVSAGQTTAIDGILLGIIPAFLSNRISNLKKGDTEYVKKAFELFNQLLPSLEKLESVVSGYEGVLIEMTTLLTTRLPDDGPLDPSSAVLWQLIEDKFRVLNEQGSKARDFLDHHRITSDDAPSLVDLTSEATSATKLGL